MMDQSSDVETDDLMVAIADYVCDQSEFNEEAYDSAVLCLMDAIACAFLALDFPHCSRLLGPVVPRAELDKGARVLGTRYQLDPTQAAFNMGIMIRWLDFNDTWLAEEWGHPSDNIATILAMTDYLGRQHGESLSIRDLLKAMIKVYEIQGVLSLNHRFNLRGYDHVLLVRIASTAVATALLTQNKQQVVNALSNAWMDGVTLRAYRHSPNTGSRKSWAAGDQCRRAVQLALMSVKGEQGYQSVITTPDWGFNDTFYQGESISLCQSLDSFIIENILFKIGFPAEFHAQTAVECAIELHPQIKHRLQDIEQIRLETQWSAMHIINKTGELKNPADRDHCLQYMVAVALLKGNLKAEDYTDESAQDPRIDPLREKMWVFENLQFSKDYLNPAKRSIGNSIQVFFKDQSCSDKVSVDYPLGHKKRRQEAMPGLYEKFEKATAQKLSKEKYKKLVKLFHNRQKLENMSVNTFMDLLTPED